MDTERINQEELTQWLVDFFICKVVNYLFTYGGIRDHNPPPRAFFRFVGNNIKAKANKCREIMDRICSSCFNTTQKGLIRLHVTDLSDPKQFYRVGDVIKPKDENHLKRALGLYSGVSQPVKRYIQSVLLTRQEDGACPKNLQFLSEGERIHLVTTLYHCFDQGFNAFVFSSPFDIPTSNEDCYFLLKGPELFTSRTSNAISQVLRPSTDSTFDIEFFQGLSRMTSAVSSPPKRKRNAQDEEIEVQRKKFRDLTL